MTFLKHQRSYIEVYGSLIKNFQPCSSLTLSLSSSSLLPYIPLQLFCWAINKNVDSDNHITFTSDRVWLEGLLRGIDIG
jgi:hypothetical protein